MEEPIVVMLSQLEKIVLEHGEKEFEVTGLEPQFKLNKASDSLDKGIRVDFLYQGKILDYPFYDYMTLKSILANHLGLTNAVGDYAFKFRALTIDTDKTVLGLNLQISLMENKELNFTRSI